ncbi:DnaJ domain-containing protein [Dioscorea alata]|uniref:DnaJ domain-containing protein n=1 Tax=Dioscorea alata TaxID=55571 RepID=A0ACB7VVJ5_DIOAL|nr:DnaJ domain-containing protein [Dioscorea alata]
MSISTNALLSLSLSLSGAVSRLLELAGVLLRSSRRSRSSSLASTSMDDLPDLLARDFGLRPKGKSAPMAPPAGSNRSRSGSTSEGVFGGPPRFSQSRSPPSSDSSKASSLPVYDKPVYDDDIFDGIPGMKSSTSAKYDDVFASNGSAGFEALIPGFGRSSPLQRSKLPESNYQRTSVPSSKSTSNVTGDPFVVLETSASANSTSGLFTDPLEQISSPMRSGSTKINASPASGGLFDDVDAFGGLQKSTPSFTSVKKENGKADSHRNTVQNVVHLDPFADLEQRTRPSSKTFKNAVPKMRAAGGNQEKNQMVFEKPSKTPDSFEDIGRSGSSRSEGNVKHCERNATAGLSHKLNQHLEEADDVWLNVSEIPLFTQLTSAPSPSRPPPPLDLKHTSTGKASQNASVGINSQGKHNRSFDQSSQSYENSMRNSGASPIEELETFAMGRPQAFANGHANFIYNEDNFERKSAAEASAAAMKEAMDKAEAKFKHGKEAREKECNARPVKSRGTTDRERHGKTIHDPLDFGYHEKEQREREEKEKKEKRLEKEKELEHRRDRERQAVERARREAQERAASEAHLKFERAAFQRMVTEACRRDERAAVDKIAAQSQEKTAAQSQVRDATQSREKQHKNENDLESFFGMGTRANSAPKQRATTSENFFDARVQSKEASDTTQRSSTSPSTIRKASSVTNIVDDLASIFGGSPSSGEFQEVEGESEERRRARFERHQRTLDCMAKALAEKNERDMQTRMEQEERHRIAETLDIEIKRWAAGKEGNLRALLSTLQYVLWPECGWQPASLTDLITSASVKKVYRKATLCVHPDKVQQKGANLQQKYIAEKVFDLLKEAWNKFNAEELL